LIIITAALKDLPPSNIVQHLSRLCPSSACFSCSVAACLTRVTPFCTTRHYTEAARMVLLT
jgi:hypothetical protein